MTQYQFYNIIFFIIINLIFGSPLVFDTEMGECTVMGVSSKHSNIVQDIIITYSKEVNEIFYPILHKPYSIYFAKNLEDFHQQSGPSTPEWAFAITKKNPNRIIMQYPNNINILNKILVHELNHIYLNNLVQSYTVPSWFKEGMAVNESGEFSINHIIIFSTAKWNNQLFRINQLSTFSTVNKNNSKLAYAQSYLMFNALEDSYGAGIYSNIIKKMIQGKTFWDALFDITGDDEYSIKEKINFFLDGKYNWMFLFNKYNLIFSFLPIILILGYIYKRYKNKKLLRKWELEDLLEDLQNNDQPN